jgi:hypothetical protein
LSESRKAGRRHGRGARTSYSRQLPADRRIPPSQRPDACGGSACARTRSRWRWSYVLVLVSIANATPTVATATKSMSPRPGHGRDRRTRQPTRSRAPSARRTSSSDRAPILLRPARASQCRAYTPKARATSNTSPAAAIAPALAARSASRRAPRLPVAAVPARPSRRYCWRRTQFKPGAPLFETGSTWRAGHNAYVLSPRVRPGARCCLHEPSRRLSCWQERRLPDGLSRRRALPPISPPLEPGQPIATPTDCPDAASATAGARPPRVRGACRRPRCQSGLPTELPASSVSIAASAAASPSAAA